MVSFSSGQGERHRYAVRIASVLDRVAAGVKAGWLARTVGQAESVLSEWRRGTRFLPAYAVPLVDEALGEHQLLEELAAMEGCGIFALEPEAMSLEDLARLIPQIIREEGTTNADVFEAMADGVLDEGERARLHGHFSKLETFFRDAKERTAPNEKAGSRVPA